MNDTLPVFAAITRGPVCDADSCTATPLGQWQRRLTPDEITVEHARIQGLWDAAFLLRDQSKPDPIQPPMPDCADYTRAVYACGDHAIALDAAALIHQAECSGPDTPGLPDCDCTPEPAPEPDIHEPAAVPEHWAAAMAAGG